MKLFAVLTVQLHGVVIVIGTDVDTADTLTVEGETDTHSVPRPICVTVVVAARTDGPIVSRAKS